MDRLEFFITEKNGIVVVSFLGIITGDTIPVLNDVFEQVQERSPQLLIVNCHDLLDMDEKCVDGLTQFNDLVRGLPAAISYCFVHPSVRKLLLGSGKIAESDIKNNFIEAVNSLPVAEKKAA